ncbi:MAG: ABC transporter permease subunit, partial [Aliifodinibius sp.]|nr:carbohydrate ABC transporter permease [Fodinibius sp.]NIV15235.1 ABC transporter permease subunit [Fodinibius sp.]NIY29101.1 ABC transporter permease subunit [Fodinibius sp.]
MAGFGWRQLDDERLQKWILYINIFVLMIPGAAVWIFRYQLLSWLEWIDTPLALVVPAFAATNPLFALITFLGYQQIPDEILESAVLDGASPWELFIKIIIPLSIP